MLYDNTGHIFHAAVANFDCVSVENLVEFVFLGKCLLTSQRKIFATLVWTFLLYGGLNHIIFLFLFLFRDVLFRSFVYKISSLYPLDFSASW